MTRPPAKPIGLKVEEAITTADIDLETFCPPEDTNLTARNTIIQFEATASLKGWANVKSQEKRLRQNSESIVMLKDYTMKDLKLTR